MCNFVFVKILQYIHKEDSDFFGYVIYRKSTESSARELRNLLKRKKTAKYIHIWILGFFI